MAKTLPPLTELRQWLRYDAQAGEFFWIKCPGKKMQPGKKAGSIRRGGYIEIALHGQRMAAHRLAWLFVHKQDPGEHAIDHVNCDPSDNKICNLRLASSADNARNQRKKSGTSSKYKGVSWYKRKGKWIAHIRIEGRARHLGYFSDEQAAHAAYCAAAAQAFGDFARFS